MKNNYVWKILRMICIPVLIILLVASGSAIWFFNASKIAETGLETNIKTDQLAVDDIAENYSFASDTSATYYYNVYVFPQLMASNYASSKGTIKKQETGLTFTRDTVESTGTSTTTYTYTLGSQQTATNSTLAGTSDPTYYLLVGGYSSKSNCLYANNGSLTYSTSIPLSTSGTSSTTADYDSYLWTYDSSAKSFKNLGTSSYLYISKNNVSLNTSSTTNTSVSTLTESDSTYWSISGTYGSKTYYMRIGQSSGLGTKDNTTSGGTGWNIYSVTRSEKTTSSSTTSTVYTTTVNGQTYTYTESSTEEGIYTATYNGTTHYYDSSNGYAYTYATNQTFTNPVDWYDYMKNNNQTTKYQNDTYGYWGTVKNNGKGNQSTSNNQSTASVTHYSDASYGFDGTVYGYHKITAYKQMTSAQFNEIPDVSCTKDVDNWSVNFVGFTADQSTAYIYYNAIYSKNHAAYYDATFFDISKPLKDYDSDGDRNIYLYPLFANGDGKGNPNTDKTKPTLDILESGVENKAYNYDIRPLPSEDLTSTTDYSYNYYYTVSFLYAADTNPNSRYHTYNKSSSYSFMAAPLDSGNTSSSGSYSVTCTLGDYINTYMVSGVYYNLYIYYAQGSSSISSADTNVESVMAQKNIVNTTNNTMSGTASGVYYFVKFYLERIYDFKITGDLTNSYDYTTGSQTNNLILGMESTPTDNGTEYYVYESPELVFTSSDYYNFVVNFGYHYENSVLKLDSDYANNTNDVNKVLQDDGTQYTDSSGNLCYYKTDMLDAIKDYDSTIETDGQQLPIVSVKGNGTYKFRVRVKYSAGFPTEILISEAYLRGLFVELHINNTDNTFDFIGDTGFIDHTSKANTSTYKVYRAYLASQGSLDFNNTKFYLVGDSSATAVYLKDMWTSIITSNSYQLYDHVLGSLFKITKDGIVQNGAAASTTSTGLIKNYVFYLNQNPS